ncbi:hypothetical protein [Streptomyces sp. NPDC050988]|uniref:hypothetical protein n=1 Tax=Streptomyces sp. NPDC050988 TaxID=3365637 RepID=UPI00379696C3
MSGEQVHPLRGDRLVQLTFGDRTEAVRRAAGEKSDGAGGAVLGSVGDGAVRMAPSARMLSAWACAPVKFCMNREGRSTAHSSNRPGSARCTIPTAGPPSGIAEELRSTARRTPATRARRRKPGTPPLDRVPAVLDALLCFKFDNRHLALALEATGSDSPYQAEHYERWHSLLRSALDEIPGRANADFTAHALLASVRADLVEHLAGQKGVPREDMRKQLASFVAEVLGTGPDEAR